MNIIEGEFKEYEDGTHTGITPKEHKDYRTWVYNRIDGEMQSKIVDGPTAVELYAEGWKMTPAEFTEDEELKGNPQFEAVADDMAQVMNFLLNLEHCEDLMALQEFAEQFLKIKVNKRWKVQTLVKKITEKATELGMMEDDNSSNDN